MIKLINWIILTTVSKVLHLNINSATFQVDEDDKLPKNICIQCCTKLQTVCDFIDTARKAQEYLLNRSIMLEEINDTCVNEFSNVSVTDIKTEVYSDEEAKFSGMEVSVDPMMVLQNSEELLSPNPEDISEDVTYLHGVDGENVTIKLIKRGDKAVEPNVDKKEYNWKPFPCVTCKRSFTTELALKNHSWIHINEDKLNQQYRCTSCSDSFDYKCDLIAHLKEHRNSGMCQLCGRV